MFIPLLINLASCVTEVKQSKIVEPKIELSLKLDRTEFRVGENPGLRLEIKNVGVSTTRLIQIQDGSLWHWVNPKVGWSLQPVDREPMPVETPKITTPRCGNMNPLTASAFFELKKGEKVQLDPVWSFPFLDVKPGEYRICFHYEISSSDLPRKSLQPESGDLLEKYRDLSSIKARSNVVRIKISP